MKRRSALAAWMWSAMAGATVLSGCAKYQTPGGPADLRAMGISRGEQIERTDANILEKMSRKPAADFPASIAVVRVQSAGYESYTARGHGQGNYSVLTTREAESDTEMARLESLPMVRGIATMNRLVVPQYLSTEKDLREAAAAVHADMVLLYTFDTRFGVTTKIPALGMITLGLFPDRESQVTSTASAALIDTRTGFIYGLAEATSKAHQPANAWTSQDAVDESRQRAEREAFVNLVGEVEKMWRGVAETYAVTRAVSGESEAAVR
ncbi:MAG: hypothetical protein AB7G17_03830 [Phycisphaerales bacterium]